MGLFKKRVRKVYPKITFRFYMNVSGKAEDEIIECVDVTDESELVAMCEAEKRFPRLKIAKVERIQKSE